MVKTILIPVDDKVHAFMKKKKGKMTWQQVLALGITKIKGGKNEKRLK